MLQAMLPLVGNLKIINQSYAETLTTQEGNYEYKILEDGTVEITKYKGSDAKVTIPSSIDGKSVTSIGDGAFSSCSSLTSVEIPNSVTSIGFDAFSSCSSLTSVEIPNSVTSIESYAFSSCSSLTSVEIPNSVTSIGSDAFYDCSSLTKIDVSKENTEYSSIDGVLFNKEQTKIIKYPEAKNATSYTIPSSVTSIGDRAFSDCSNLTSVEIPSSVTSIGDEAFSSCSSLTSVEIPSSVTSIGSYAFYRCSSLTSVEIPNSVTSIGNRAFSRCSSLTSVEIPSSVTSIGTGVFINATLTIATAKQEVELPDIIKRAKKEGDILYTEQNFTLHNCTISEDNTKLIIDKNITSNSEVSLKVNGGALDELTVVVESGTILYSTTNWTNGTVEAKLFVADGETITNNGGKNTYTFDKNGEFTFEYTTAEGEKETATAKVNNIYKLGDINEDSKINILDLLLLKRHILAESKEEWKLKDIKLKAADINEDGNINIIDLLLEKKLILNNNKK